MVVVPESPSASAGKELARSAATRALDLALPGAGSFVDLVIRPVLAARTAAWVAKVDAEILRLADAHRAQGIELELHDARITDAYMLALQAVQRTSDEAKLQALQNAVLHAATDPNDDMPLCLSIIDRMTPQHLQLLDFARNPAEGCRRFGKDRRLRDGDSLIHILRECWPAFASKEETFRFIVKDFETLGILEDGDIMRFRYYPHRDGTVYFEPKLTALGMKVVQMLASPKA